jgi:hypothetical protein
MDDVDFDDSNRETDVGAKVQIRIESSSDSINELIDQDFPKPSFGGLTPIKSGTGRFNFPKNVQRTKAQDRLS